MHTFILYKLFDNINHLPDIQPCRNTENTSNYNKYPNIPSSIAYNSSMLLAFVVFCKTVATTYLFYITVWTSHAKTIHRGMFYTITNK